MSLYAHFQTRRLAWRLSAGDAEYVLKRGRGGQGFGMDHASVRGAGRGLEKTMKKREKVGGGDAVVPQPLPFGSPWCFNCCNVVAWVCVSDFKGLAKVLIRKTRPNTA